MNDADIHFFWTFGYRVFRQLLAEEIDHIATDFDRLMGASRTLDQEGRPARTLHWQAIDSSPRLSALIDNLKVVGIFDALLGPDWQYFGSVANHYTGNTGWHTDDFSFHDKVKIAIYLDETGPGRGGLSVIPRTHVPSLEVVELQLDVGMSERALGVPGASVPCTTLTTRPGDVVVFHQNLMHSSWGGGDKRRMLSINAHARYEDEELLLDNVLRTARFRPQSAYGPFMNCTAMPIARRVHLEQMLRHENSMLAEVDRIVRSVPGGAVDLLPDMSSNLDREAAAEEFARDTDYRSTVAVLKAEADA
ncbi:phytanoyl-CoA dioxygenase family protein [Streptomyces erythrochromogenes]|uniref:phytanoyl-CoA dioxygenase family protein n=1 Tax=Streptomyces erythrochromogenes TaxID=285574 RepID=UPI00341F21AA